MICMRCLSRVFKVSKYGNEAGAETGAEAGAEEIRFMKGCVVRDI